MLYLPDHMHLNFRGLLRGPMVGLLAGSVLLCAAPLAAQQPMPPGYKSGFPVKFTGQGNPNGSSLYSQPVAADLGLTPGYKSIIFGLRNGKLYVVEHKNNGTWGAAAGWPVQLPAHIASSPAVADLNGNGTPDIVVGYGSTLDTGSHGGLKAFDRNGTQLWEVLTDDVTPGPSNGLRDPVFSTPAIGDIDGDGTVEVVFGGLDHKLYVVNGENGQPNSAAWPRDMRDTVFSSPVLHDIDGDSRRDIIVGTDAHTEGPPINTQNGGYLHVLRYDGNPVGGFPKYVDQVVSSSPAVGDIDGDGKPEIVHGTGTFWNASNNPGNPPEHAVYAWNCDGTAVAGWPVAVTGEVATSPALANLEGTAALEVVVTDIVLSPRSHRVYAIRGNGTKMWERVPLDFFGSNPALGAGEPVIGDVLGDTGPDILVPTNGEVVVFSASGTQLTEDGPSYSNQKVSFTTQYSLDNVAVTDLETDGAGNQIEVIAISAEPFSNPTTTVVHVWNPVARTSTPPWGFFHQNERRTGVAPGTGACTGSAVACTPNSAAADFFTIPPCRVADTRNANGPRGGPVMTNGTRRTFPVGSACGIPATATAVAVNVTVTQPTAPGHLRFGPGGCTALPVTSTINFSAGQTRANNAILPLAVDGSGGLTAEAALLAGGGAHLILDVTGYFE